MKKGWKICGVVFFLGCMFIVGYLSFGETGILGKKREVQQLMEYSNARNSDENIYGGELTKKDAEFIQEHVLGQWRISKRIKSLRTGNISAKGVEEMKSLIITYDKDFARIEGYDQLTFSNPRDVYFYNQCGGNYGLNLPVYHVNWHVDENNIPVNNGDFQMEEVVFPLKCELVYVFYNLGYTEEDYPSVTCCYDYAADQIYVDPKDTDKLYLSFCGLWELERVSK